MQQIAKPQQQYCSIVLKCQKALYWIFNSLSINNIKWKLANVLTYTWENEQQLKKQHNTDLNYGFINRCQQSKNKIVYVK